jgi:uncharacterized protein (DUF4415 family)
MTASKNAMPPSWTDPDDAPELTEAQLREADLYEGDKFIRRGGRPKGSGIKELVSLRIDRNILEHFCRGGPGWQTRLNDACVRCWARSSRGASKAGSKRSGRPLAQEGPTPA